MLQNAEPTTPTVIVKKYFHPTCAGVASITVIIQRFILSCHKLLFPLNFSFKQLCSSHHQGYENRKCLVIGLVVSVSIIEHI